MRKQESRMSPHPGNLPSPKDMQLWQKHLIYKQLQEIQRQQQLQQLEQGSRQHNLLSQVVSKQGIYNQLPPLLNGMPINDSSSYSLPNNIAAANTNWAQGRGTPSVHGSYGLMFSNDHDQSLYGTSVSNSKVLLNQYPRFQGVSNNFTDVVGNQSEKATLYSIPCNSSHKDQCVPEEPCLQSPSGGTMLGNFHKVNHELQSGQGATSLDPTEEKILFGRDDDDGNWDASLGSILHGNPLEGNDQFGGFPSLQSGSWSALMQEAVQATSSDNGFQEDWNGLSFQKTEQSIGNSPAVHSDHNNFQSASSMNLRPFPFANDANIGPQTDVSNESFQQSFKDEQRMHFDQIRNQNQNFDAVIEAQIQSDDVDNGMWSRHMYQESSNPAQSASIGFNSKNDQGILCHQQNTPVSNIIRQPDTNPTGWNKFLAAHGGGTSNGPDNTSSGMQPVKSDSGRSQIQSIPFSISNDAVMNSENEIVNHKMNLHANSPSPSISDSQASSGLSSWKTVGSCKLSHPMQNMGKNVERADSPKDTAYSQGLLKLAVQDSRSQEQEYARHSEFVSQGISNMGMGHSTDMQSINSREETQYRSKMHRQTSQNMLELLHKVDQSRVINTEAYYGNSDLNRQNEIHKAAHQSSSFQGFGVGLASPSQQQAVPNHDLHVPKPLLEFNRRQHNSSDQTLHHSPETSQKENSYDRSDLSGQNLKVISQSIAEGNSSAVTASRLSYMARQLQLQKQWQLLQNQAHHSVNLSFKSQADLDEHVKHASLRRQSQMLRDIALSGQSVQTSFPTVDERMLTSTLRTQQAGASAILNNVWKNASAQQGISQSVLSSSSRDKNSEAMEMENDGGNNGRSVPSELGTHSENLQQFTLEDKHLVGENFLQGTHTEKIGSASEEQEQMPKLHLNDNKGKHGLNVSSLDSDVGLYGQTTIPSKVQQTNYSLLQQMQAMKGSDFNTSLSYEKRLNEDASQMEWKAGMGCVYGQNSVPKVLVDGKLCAISHSSFPSDDKMRSFSSSENEEQSTEKTSQLVSTPNIIGKSEHPLISPQMSQSWLERYRKYKNGQILSMYADQKSRASPQQYFHPEISERIDSDTLAEQKIETSPSVLSNKSASPLPFNIIGHGEVVVMKSRKRKTATSDLLPWHQVVSFGVRRLQNISTAERDWAQAANRLTEKAEDEVEMIEDGLSMPRAKRRLILTTQLTQQLLPCVPASVLAAEMTSTYEIMTYYLAKSALEDVCSLISLSRSDMHAYLDDENRISEKYKTMQKANDVYFSKVMENFIGRSRKLESDFSRLDKRTSVLDIRLECQELERFSLVNRLGKFHNRSQADGGAESSSTSQSQNPPRKMFPQRYVTAFSVPGKIPYGVHCLSL